MVEATGFVRNGIAIVTRSVNRVSHDLLVPNLVAANYALQQRSKAALQYLLGCGSSSRKILRCNLLREPLYI